MRRTSSIITATVLTLTVGLTGCSNSGSETTTTTTTTPAAQAPSGTPEGVTLSGDVNDHGTETAAITDNKIEIGLYDDYFLPTFIKVEPGKSYKVELKNEGDSLHTFTSKALGLDVSLAPGAEKTVDLKAPANGAAEFICKPHESLGMRGAVFTS